LGLVRRAKVHDPQNFKRLRTVPGIGKILAMIILYEIHDIGRFPRVQDFVSYARLVKCAAESAGKRFGTSGAKIGDVHLKWAFSEAAVLSLNNDAMKRFFARLEKKHGKGKALSILAHKLGRAVYFMMKREEVFRVEEFVKR
jgi:transposase